MAGYLPIRSELDPRPLMLALSGLGFTICTPVVEGPDLPLRFRVWTPRSRLERGAFGVDVPAKGHWVTPDAILVPLLAFDSSGWRLGYGGGFYDRTLADLRARRTVSAIGFAYAGQEVDTVPHGENDTGLDAIVTEAGVILSRA